MNDKQEPSIGVRALLELAVDSVTPPLITKGGQLAADIRANAVKARYVKSPDGWFVPIHELSTQIEKVAELLHFEIVQRGGEFDVAGGLEIMTDLGISLEVSPSSTFRFAVDFANTIIDLRHENEEREVFIGNQEIWELWLHHGDIWIRVQQAAGHDTRELKLPIEPLRMRLTVAANQVESFALKLEPVLLAYRDVGITSEMIQWTFGIDKLQDRRSAG